VLETAWAANPGDYTLLLEFDEPQTLPADSVTIDAPAEQCLYQFEGRGGQFVAVTMEALEPGGDPTLTLLDDQGATILYNDDTFGLNSRLAMILPADGRYFLKAGWYASPGDYTLRFRQVEPETLAIGDTLTALTPEQAVWRFDGSEGDLLTVTMDAADPEGDPLLGLYDETGQAIGQADGGGTGLNARMVVTLPADGVYLIDAGWLGEPTTYSLSTSQQLQAGELSLPTDSVEAGPELWAWQFQGDFGDVVTIRMEALEEGGSPLLRLYDPFGKYLDLPVNIPDDGGSAELSYTLTQAGLFQIEAGWASNPGRYRLTIDLSQPEIDMTYVGNVLRGNLLQLLEDGLITDALTLLTQIERIEAAGQTGVLLTEDYNQVCWHGSLLGYAASVLFACDEAVRRDPENVAIIDSRGIARAQVGDFAGAIADFQAFLDGGYAGNEQWRAEREQWIAELQAGRNPFEDATLREYIRLNE
jgi:hypothetical protein